MTTFRRIITTIGTSGIDPSKTTWGINRQGICNKLRRRLSSAVSGLESFYQAANQLILISIESIMDFYYLLKPEKFASDFEKGMMRQVMGDVKKRLSLNKGLIPSDQPPPASRVSYWRKLSKREIN